MTEADLLEGLQRVLILAPIVLFSLSFHELAHAWVADRLGDPTARNLGRVTMDPLKHIDPIGTVLIPGIAIFLSSFALVGWAKPVPVNPMNFEKWQRDDTIVALAGPASNILLALVFALVFMLLASFDLVTKMQYVSKITLFSDFRLEAFLWYGMSVNIALAVFNMFPVPPLDGSHILTNYLPEKYGEPLRAIGFAGILIILFLLNFTPFGDLFVWLVETISVPFTFLYI